MRATNAHPKGSRPLRSILPTIGFLAAVILLVVGVSASLLDADEMADSAARVGEVRDVIAQLDDVSLGIERIVTMARVFVLTGDEDFILPLEGLKLEIAAGLADLKEMLGSDSEQLRLLDELDTLVAERIELSDGYIELRRRTDLEQTVAEIPPGGEELAEDIRGLILDLEQRQTAALDRQRAASAAIHATTIATIALSGLLSLILLALVFVALRKRINEQIALKREVVAVSEIERSRFGHDLHDGLGQHLTGISLGLAALANDLEREGSSHAGAVRRIEDHTRSAIAQTRRIARSLSPGFDGKLTLCDALRSLARSLHHDVSVDCRVSCPPEAHVHDEETAMQLFRIAQEAVSNALRHGKPQHISISLARNGHHGHLNVSDDGVGIPPPHEIDEGFGIRSMRYRADMIGARLRIAPRRGGGTAVLCAFEFGEPGAA